MGCVSAKADSQRDAIKTEQALKHLHSNNSYDSLQSPEKYPQAPKKSRAASIATGVSSNAESSQRLKSVVSLSQALMKSNIDAGDGEQDNLQSWIEEHNTTSSIIKLPKSGKKGKGKEESEVKRSRSLVQNFEKCENIDGELRTDAKMQKITISNLEIDVQFLLSKCRAGPLVVPYIAYDQYSTD